MRTVLAMTGYFGRVRRFSLTYKVQETGRHRGRPLRLYLGTLPVPSRFFPSPQHTYLALTLAEENIRGRGTLAAAEDAVRDIDKSRLRLPHRDLMREQAVRPTPLVHGVDAHRERSVGIIPVIYDLRLRPMRRYAVIIALGV